MLSAAVKSIPQKSILYSESMKAHKTVTPEANPIVIYGRLLKANYVSITKFLRLYVEAFLGMGNQHMNTIYDFKDSQQKSFPLMYFPKQ